MALLRLVALGIALGLLACTGCSASSPGAGACTSSADCRAGQTCTDGRCRASDGGTPADASCPAARTCGAACCPAGQICGAGLCCAPGDLCGGACCGPDRTCEADRCVLDCGMNTPCGTGMAATCCTASDLCYLGACTTPGPPCTSARDCPAGSYCEATAMRCLPRATGSTCEYRPPVGMLELATEWAWSSDTVMPGHNQVMMAPMVANLTDDNADGVIDENDTPDVVFNTFTGSNYWGDGVLRAISGADGSRVWPTATPGYRTTGGSEIAIADVVPTSPGPEVMTCSASSGASRTPGHLIIVAADGTLLRRFDTPPNDVPCGFDAPAVGDMNGDGIPEIVVRFAIAHSDGTVVRRIRDLRGASYSYITLADVDADTQLELVASNGVYRYDGTPLWERVVAGARPAVPDGHPALADLDLNGTAEIVTVSAGDHSVRALDAATGADVWGPIDINPPELAAVIAADGRPIGGGPVTIANFDADPAPEIAFAGGFAYVIFEGNGTRKWWYETIDRSSRQTGSSIFDFEGDGVAEVLYNDERSFRVFRGPDGTVMHERCNTSGTLKEFPIVVDVDNDDQAEIILMQNNYAFRCLDGSPSSTGIIVLGHPRNEWVRTRRIFNQHTYHVTNINEDGTVPTTEQVNWTAPGLNNFRQNVQPDGLFDAPDLVAIDFHASTTSCPVSMELSVRIVNQGASGAPAGIPVTFYDVTGGTRVLVGRAVTTRPLLPGESEVILLSPPFPVPAGMATTTFLFEVVINDPADMPLDTFHQCREDNDTLGPIEARCPVIG